MTKILIVFPLAAILLAAADVPRTDAPVQTAPPPAALAVPSGIPAGAVQVGPNSYRVTRPDGKNWLYHRSPFGIMSAEERQAPQAAGDAALALVTAAAQDGMIRFERRTPLGPFHWQKKESDLNEMEKAVWQRDQPRSGSAQE